MLGAIASAAKRRWPKTRPVCINQRLIVANNQYPIDAKTWKFILALNEQSEPFEIEFTRKIVYTAIPPEESAVRHDRGIIPQKVKRQKLHISNNDVIIFNARPYQLVRQMKPDTWVATDFSAEGFPEVLLIFRPKVTSD